MKDYLKKKDYYENLDKRTKEYKEYKAAMKELESSTGLGDTIEKVTKSTGIKDMVSFFFGEDCGCEERKDKLNNIFRYKTRALTQDEFLYLDEYYKRDSNKVTRDEINRLYAIHNRVFNSKAKPTHCVPCVNTLLNKLKTIYTKHNEIILGQ